jgi:predicted transcriptional regulator
MKQGLLTGFGASHLTGAIPPLDMPDDVVAMCKTEAQAIARSISFAKARFGYTQLDIAKLLGMTGESHLSEYKSGKDQMPEKYWRKFAQVTGSNLLEQVQIRDRATDCLSGRVTENDINRAVLARMLMVAAA